MPTPRPLQNMIGHSVNKLLIAWSRINIIAFGQRQPRPLPTPRAPTPSRKPDTNDDTRKRQNNQDKISDTEDDTRKQPRDQDKKPDEPMVDLAAPGAEPRAESSLRLLVRVALTPLIVLNDHVDYRAVIRSPGYWRD